MKTGLKYGDIQKTLQVNMFPDAPQPQNDTRIQNEGDLEFMAKKLSHNI